jgi:arabinogalactan endo-1,4-beta-galactosidase
MKAENQEFRPWRRRAVVLTGAAMAAGLLAVTLPTSGGALTPALRIRGADISFTLQEEAIKQTLSDNGVPAPLERILAARGANYARLRVWVHPAPGTSDLAAALELGRRAHTAGLSLLLNIHYSDSWADRTAQQTPKAWQGQTKEQLEQTVETYTRDVVAQFAQQHTPVEIVQIGNEITHGFLWPTGRIYSLDGEKWSDFASLVKAGIRGAKAGNPARPPRIMIHSDTGGDRDSTVYFYDHLLSQGVTFDLIGLTYYPFWHGSLSDLRENLRVLEARYNRDIVIAETAYPWTLASGGGVPSVVTDIQALPDADAYPPTPQGQAKFFEALNRVLREVPNGRGAGYFIWEPGWLPGVNADSRVGNTHSNLTLFDWWGHGLPALDAFRPTGGAGRGQ